MIRRPEFTPASTTEFPGPDLFMTVLKVRDWKSSLAWYVENLGLLELRTDPEHEFVLLAAGAGRLALQGDQGAPRPDPAGGARLVFLVPDAAVMREALAARGVAVGPVLENVDEGYREVRLHDPDGTPLTCFSWTGPARGPGDDQPPER